MALTANDLLLRCAAIYNDTSYNRISNSTSDNPNWFQFFDDALRQLILVRPDAYTTTTTMQLTSGTKQSLPSAGIRLLDIHRNMGTNGSTVGAPIHYIDRKILDASLVTWHSEAQQHYIDNYWFDPDNPTVFWVTPPNSGSGYIELTYSILHTALTATGDSVAVKDIFLMPLVSWCLYRAFLVDTDSPYGFERAQFFYRDFMQTLGIEEKVQEEKAPSNPMKGRGV